MFESFAAAIIGGVVWAVRLEGRVNTAIQRHEDLKELINTKFDAIEQRLDRIERALNGALHPHD